MTGRDTTLDLPLGPRRREQVVLDVRGLVKAYDDTVVLGGINLTVAEHEVVTLIGSSGSGKSTLLRCAGVLEPISDGQILLDGQDISDPRIDADAVRARFGVVFQAYNLFPHMTVRDNVTLAPRVVHGVSAKDARARAEALLERVGLADKADAYPDRLSGGQQQRAAIARAIAVEPRVLLLDEITSALDPELVGEVLALVRELAASGATILMATHEMGFAKQVADHVVFLDQGVVCEEGPPAQVLGEPTQPRTQEFLGRVIDAGRL
ncbi:amino acid ABC transporter ATP-binding protein [Ornithinicoccus hortensis]|uniref:Amino acid ABC transporter ATP-binding protein (PAAT family) n=1 Tax=Ornithinicoccus hortensis TaxID=82346 RepID=A0A542YML4_9MICO|nr:amino acid ABC transporter ATP-binding protein [Ornithinicoccus hortensis]TQL49327.1 amino acid ABC transporter ATP-binding protein (PAAT family) [Ornithinicoccus hortensis]